MPLMSGGQAVVRALRAEGVEVVFGLPGVQIMHIYDGFFDTPDVRLITVRHEQAAAFMADGYARTTGKPGVALVVPGPGAYNAGAGMATAYAAYPHPEATPVSLNPTGRRNGVGDLSLDAPDDPGQGVLVDDVSWDGTRLASQAESDNRLIYATPELTQDLHLSGVATVKIRVAANREAANLSVWLVSLPITEGGAITDNLIFDFLPSF